MVLPYFLCLSLCATQSGVDVWGSKVSTESRVTWLSALCLNMEQQPLFTVGNLTSLLSEECTGASRALERSNLTSPNARKLTSKRRYPRYICSIAKGCDSSG